ncbi:MAG: alternative oxidase [Pseudomonadota bacterium]
MKDYPITYRRTPDTAKDRAAFFLVKMMRLVADAFFSKRYGHRAVVLETVAAVPGMVGGMLQHLKSLRLIRDDNGMIKALLDEAENERQHLMAFIKIAQPNAFERAVVLITQGIFFNAYFLAYMFMPRTAHRFVAYLEEEAVVSYTRYLEEIEDGRIDNADIPQSAKDYWNLGQDARLRELVIAVRLDEAGHRDANHSFADAMATDSDRGHLSGHAEEAVSHGHG